MRKFLYALIALAIVVVTGQLRATPEAEAQKIAEQWLALVDGGKHAESWDAASGYFRNAITKEKWGSALNAARSPLGALVSRKLKNVQHNTVLPGVLDGDSVVMQFDTEFANKKASVETVTVMLDKDGIWRVAGYFIK